MGTGRAQDCRLWLGSPYINPQEDHVRNTRLPSFGNGCGHCKNLAPEYEKDATILSKNDLSILLVKIDTNEEANKDLVAEHDVKGYPTLKYSQEYKGPREADRIVEYLKKQNDLCSC